MGKPELYQHSSSLERVREAAKVYQTPYEVIREKITQNISGLRLRITSHNPKKKSQSKVGSSSFGRYYTRSLKRCLEDKASKLMPNNQ